VIKIIPGGDVIPVAIHYPQSAIVYKAAIKPLISLSGECLLKNLNCTARVYARNVDLAPMEQTSKLAIENINSEGTDE
jgi:hypothetical protein